MRPLPPTLSDLQRMEGDNWEHMIVRNMCSRLKIPTEVRREMEQFSVRAGLRPRLTFAAFHEVLPEFPFYFSTKLLRNLGKTVTVSKLFTRFSRTVLYQEYQKAKEEIPETAEALRFGFVFRWPRLTGPGEQGTGLVMHDGEPDPGYPGFEMTWAGKDSEERLVITLLPRLLDSLKAGGQWQ